ncbi:neuronal acetylcholine receptor subunit alpha-10-like [Paramacrobiotus metropolitanus]|uniref:neuronal acetylcholine receptor subunit alpha-10-like n=1 Tax=Paramacrobiotus metropolitanus TaxID=2943436 RepID=UPI0024461578|nr:neuronal acetylcholine receptor subunit alpha-10-like [Paramacrobiotus metropolitanus]XP_055345576.1 neuronal acetylcholine receptor subunit alpha-10-like [Paramacrobiotus metropolitanus]
MWWNKYVFVLRWHLLAICLFHVIIKFHLCVGNDASGWSEYDTEIPFSYRIQSAFRDAYWEKRSSDEHKLLQYLMANYEKAARPVVNASTPITVKVGFVLTQISSVDERNQVLTTNVWFEMEWTDEVLMWDPVKFGGIRVLIMPSTKVWLPDIVLYNNADDYNKNLMPVNVVLQYNGSIFWNPPTKMRSTCKIVTTYFPFDDQKCHLKLGSWIYDGFQLDVIKRKPNVDLTAYVRSAEWDIINTTMVRNVNYYACCPEPFPDVTVHFHIRRITVYYGYNIIAPCVMLSMLTIVLFWLPCDAGEKITLGLTVLLAFSVFMLMIGETMPETSDSMPLLGIYILSTEFIASFSVAMTVTILNLHYRGFKRNHVPAWLRRLAFGYLARLTCMPPLYSIDGKLLQLPPNTQQRAARAYRNATYQSGHDADVERSLDLAEFRRLIGRHPYAGGSTPRSVELATPASNCHFLSYDSTHSASLSFASSALPPGTIPTGGGGNDIAGRVKCLLDKFDEEKKMEENLAEWRRVAEILDRVCFYIFLLLIFWTTIALLVLSPLSKAP